MTKPADNGPGARYNMYSVSRLIPAIRYTYYTAPWAHCQPALSNNLQLVDDFLKLLALDLEAVAVHNEPVGVRVFLG